MWRVVVAFACVAFLMNAGVDTVSAVEVPEGGGPPGPWVDTVTGACICVNASMVKAWGGADKDQFVVNIASAGPFPWTVSRANRGDYSPRLSPAWPFSQGHLGVVPASAGGLDVTSAASFECQSWSPSPEFGVLLPTVLSNEQVWPHDGEPKFFGTVGVALYSDGFGYSMGAPQRFGKGMGAMDVVMGKAGGKDEAIINTAVAWFPFSQGWTGAHVASVSEGLGFHTPKSFHPPSLGGGGGGDKSSVASLAPDDIGGGVVVRLPGVAAATDGMLFAVPSHSSSNNDDVNLITALPRADGSWLVQVREDFEKGNPGKLANDDETMFSFLHVPWSAPGLIGAHVIGRTGAMAMGCGRHQVTRLGTGRYSVAIEGAANRRKGMRDGMLILQNAGAYDGSLAPGAVRPATSNAFLSYEYDSASEAFVVQARQVVEDSEGTESFPLVDADWNFAWVDFREPMRPATAGSSLRQCHVATGGDGDGGGGPDGSTEEAPSDRLGLGVIVGVVVTVVGLSLVATAVWYYRKRRGLGRNLPYFPLSATDHDDDMFGD